MTMDPYDYGQVPAVSLPPASDSDDITPQLKSTLAQSQTSSQSAGACSAAIQCSRSRCGSGHAAVQSPISACSASPSGPTPVPSTGCSSIAGE